MKNYENNISKIQGNVGKAIQAVIKKIMAMKP